MARLEEAFDFVRKIFFPRWDREGAYTVREEPNLPSDGFCDRVSKTISVQWVDKNDDELHLLLIHEISHAVAPRHGKKWQDRLLKAAGRAREIGRWELSQMIVCEVEGYRKSIRLHRAKVLQVYQNIEDWVRKNPGLSYETVVGLVAQENGMYPHGFSEKFSRAKKVYQKAQKESAARKLGRGRVPESV